jgi:glycosyltransferase involved in cell wall biosynthesis
MAQRQIRISRVIARLNLGGAAAHVIQLTAGLDSQRFAQQVITGVESAGEASMLAEARARGIAPIVIPQLGREISPHGDLATLLRLYRIFRTWRPDIVETHTAKAGTVGRLAAALARVPVRVHVFHGHVFHSYFGPAKTRAFLEIERALARLSTRIITLGDVQRREILDYGVGTPAKVLAIPLGLELGQYVHAAAGESAGLRAELGLPAGAPLLGIVGRLAPIKAHEVFVDAAARIHDDTPEVHFAIVGDGERRAELGRLVAAKGLDDRVHFLGWRQANPALYQDLDVVVLTSDNEGMPVSVMEAMAAARPVVATDVGGVRSLVDDGETGLLAPRRDAGAVAAACLRLVRDADLRQTVGQRARAAVYPRFDVSTLLATMDDLYRGLCAARGSFATHPKP